MEIRVLRYFLTVVREGGMQAVRPEQTESPTMESVSPVSETANEESETGGNETSTKEENSKVLIAYFSWASG